MTSFIPSFHLNTAPADKLKAEWCNKAVNYCYHNGGNRNLLAGKNLSEIEQYATGNIDMEYFKRKMSKDLKKKMETFKGVDNPLGIDLDPAQFEPLPLIFDKLNAAQATNDKIPFEVKCTAIDPLAKKKKEEDLLFLKNKPGIEADLQPLADQMNIGKVDLGTTKHSAVPYGDSPYGLDLNEPDELQVLVDLLYSLGIEAAYETIMQEMYNNKNLIQFRHLEAKDQYWYAVSAHEAYESAITGMPDNEYIFPGSVQVPFSYLPDFSDRTHDFIDCNPTVMGLFNMMGDEICDENKLEEIINGEFGYCSCNDIKPQPYRNFDTFKVSLVKCSIRTDDWIGVKKVGDNGDDYTLTTDEKKCDHKLWAQNTYTFFWLYKTKHFFKISKLGYAHRKLGQEIYQGFGLNIYKSQEKSAVELSIGANRVAQIAYIKQIHAIMRSLPAGKVIDIKGMRAALLALKDQTGSFTMERMLLYAMEENIMIIDTEDFEGKNDGQLKPFYEIPGGLKAEIIGYENTINTQDAKIAQFTGINPQLTGQAASPEGLIGLQKLLINASQNSISYVNTAITAQYQKLFNIWGFIIKEGVEKNKQVKQAYIDMIGAQKVSLIDSLEDSSLHKMGIAIGFTQREEERALWNQYFMILLEQKILNGSDLYMLNYIQNPKDKFAMLAVKEKQFYKRQREQEQAKYEQQQALMQQQGQNQQQAIAAEADGETKKIYTKADAESKLMTLGGQLGMSKAQMDGLMKRSLQRDRGIDQERKAVSTIREKANAKQQESLI